MADVVQVQVAQLQAESAVLLQQCAELANQPEAEATLRATIALRQRQIELMGGMVGASTPTPSGSDGLQVGSITAERDVYVANTQIFNPAPRSEVQVSYAGLLAARQVYATSETFDPYMLQAPPAQVCQLLLAGLFGWVSQVEKQQLQPSQTTVRECIVWLLVPLLDRLIWPTSQQERDLIALLGADLAALMQKLALVTHISSTDRIQMVRQLAEQCSNPRYAPAFANLLAYLTHPNVWERLLAEARLQQLAQPSAGSKVDPTLSAILLATVSSATTVALMTFVQAAQTQAAAASILLHSTPPTTPTAHPLIPSLGNPTAPQPGSSSALSQAPTISPITTAPARIGPLSIPITTADWQASLVARDRMFGRHGLYQNPVPYWCYVTGGEYSIGGWEPQQPVVKHKLSDFWIARVPITVAQYRPFVAEGYHNDARHWWTPNGWAWKRDQKRTQPYQWDNARFTQPRQPVIGITWYEAMAYCNWLDERLGASMTNVQVRLPTEAEWETAAAFDAKGRRWEHSWGATTPTLDLADFGRKWQKGAKEVGERPRGAAGSGALDLVGTVWEATSSSYEAYPAQAHTPKQDFTTDHYVSAWRGGGYWSNSADVRCGARYRSGPDVDSGGDDGFRIVAAPSIAR